MSRLNCRGMIGLTGARCEEKEGATDSYCLNTHVPPRCRTMKRPASGGEQFWRSVTPIRKASVGIVLTRYGAFSIDARCLTVARTRRRAK